MLGSLPMKQSVSLILLVLGFCAHADSTHDVQNMAYWLCKNKGDVRTIRVYVNEEGVCSTYYSKQGNESSIGNGKNHGSCMNFLANVKNNLEKSNWNCRDISNTRITASEDAPH